MHIDYLIKYSNLILDLIRCLNVNLVDDIFIYKVYYYCTIYLLIPIGTNLIFN